MHVRSLFATLIESGKFPIAAGHFPASFDGL